MSLRLTQLIALVWAHTYEGRITQAFANAMGQANSARRRVTAMYANIMGRQPFDAPLADQSNRITAAWANVMIPFTPNFEWIDMVINEVFPFDISYESIGATRFSTDVVVVDSGHDQRLSRWDQPLMEYDIAYGVRTMEQLHGLISFFRAVRGRKYAFLYKDHVDHTSTLAVAEEARSSPETSPFDQRLGVGDGSKYRFQLVKRYPSPSGQYEFVRPIYRPMPGTVKVGVGNMPVDNFEVDYERGVIEFVPNWQRTNLQGMRIDPAGTPRRWEITSPDPVFGGLVVGDKIITNGWLNPANNSVAAYHLEVTWVNPDATSFIFEAPENYGEAENNRNGVNVYRHPAPPPGSVVTAGYHFYVPVRFDTDRLPVSLEEYGVGGAADVRLVEVRPAEIFDE